uniref:BolA family member 3 n=2 Tax=Rattus norvegicus TaxID=10116 RepID=A0ABK0LLV6_RAT
SENWPWQDGGLPCLQVRPVPGGNRGADAASGRQGAGSSRAANLDTVPASFRLHRDLGLRRRAWRHGAPWPLCLCSAGAAGFLNYRPGWPRTCDIPPNSWNKILPLWHCAHRMFASQTEGELKVTQVLKEKFPRATAIQVTDISGGCGAMYEIKIESEEFKAKRMVQQHQMVNQALKEEIKGMHGLRIFTSVPKC